MKHRSLLLASAVAALGLASSAHADLGWEHVGELRFSTSKTPVMRFKMYNSWTPSRHRVLVSYAFHNIPGFTMPRSTMETLAPMLPLESALNFSGAEPVAPMLRALTAAQKKASTRAAAPDKIQNFGTVGFVQRTDDDRVLAYESQTKKFVSEPRRELLRRTTFDPFKTLDPSLSQQAPPEFTPEQRKRLASEVGAFTKPLREKIQKLYFRELPQMRTIQGLRGRGYRLTQLTNTGGQKHPQWMRVNLEWWIASEGAGDETVRMFRAASRKNLEGIAWPTTSMWLREYIKMSQEPIDPITRRALNTFMPNGKDDGGLNVTPLKVSMKISLPPLQRAQTGDISFDLNLTNRYTDPIPDRVFLQPVGYTRFNLEPYVKQVEPYMNGSSWGKAIDSMYSMSGY